MSTDLFALYRYLSQNRHRKDEDNPYNVALRTLDDFIDILKDLEYWGRYITEHGGINWEDAEVIKSRIIDGAKTVLCEANGQNSTLALIDFASTSVTLIGSNYDAIQSALEALRKQQIEEDALLHEGFGEIEDHPF